MTGTGPPKYRPPERGPSPSDIDDRDRFDALARASLTGVRASAEKWRTGLAALVTLVTGGLLIKGPGEAADLTRAWRIILTLLAASGLAAAVYGLYRALKAAAGQPETQQREAIVAKYGSVLGYEVAQAKSAAQDLRRARQALLIALPLLGAAVIAWWWSEEEPSSPPAFVEVEVGEDPVCGTLKSGDNGRLRIHVSGEENPRVIELTTVKNVRVKDEC